MLNLIDCFDVLKLTLSIPILVKQVIVAPKLLGHFTDKMEILLGKETRDVDVRIVLI